MAKARFTAKQQAFIDWYVILLNGTEAARRAGYKGNDVTLAAVAYENLRKPHIRAEIDSRLRERALTADEAVSRMGDIARGNLTDYIDRFGNVDIERMKADGNGHLLKKYKRTKRTIRRKDEEPEDIEQIEIELYPADAALRDILKIHGKYGPLGTEDDPIQHRVKFIDYGLKTDDSDNADAD